MRISKTYPAVICVAMLICVSCSDERKEAPADESNQTRKNERPPISPTPPAPPPAIVADDVKSPSSKPAAATTEPAPEDKPASKTKPATKPAVSAEVKKILDALESSGGEYATIRAKVNYVVYLRMEGDTETRTGRVAFQNETKKAPAKFRVSFDTLRMGKGATIKEKEDYIFDGAWWIIARYKLKQMRRIQVAAPGERVEPFKLGQGPFLLPFGQKADDVVEMFNVSLIPPNDADPKNTDHLLLIPRKKNALDVTAAEMWIDRKLNLPVKVKTRAENKNEMIVTFSEMETGKEVEPEQFIMPKPTGWTIDVRPLKK